MATQVGLTLGDYLGMFRRHLLLATGIFMAGSIASVLVASMAPGIYESSSIIQVVPQDISTNLIPAAFDDYADQKIERIRQRVLTRDNILDIARRYHLYDVDKSASASDVVDAFNKDVAVDLINSKDPRVRNSATIAFSVSFRGKNSWTVNKVDSDLATLFLNENAKAGIARANDANSFLSQAANDLQVQLDAANRKITDFKAQNSASLPENKDVAMSAYQAADSTLRDIANQRQQIEDQISNLELQSQAATASSVDNPAAQDSTDPATELAMLKAQYAKLQAVYSDKHPTMVQLRQRIAVLEQQLNQPATASGGHDKAASAAAVASDGFSSRMARYKARLADLDRQRDQVQARMQQLQHQLLMTPQVSQQLSELQAVYDDLKKKYDDIRQKQGSAQLDASLQEENKAEHFELVEPSMMADKPIKPNRIKLLISGIGGSAVFAAVVVVVLESMGGKLRGVSALAGVSGVMPLVVIPEIESREEVARRKRALVMGFGGLLAGLVVALLVIQFFVMPLSGLVSKIQHYSTVQARGVYDKQ